MSAVTGSAVLTPVPAPPAGRHRGIPSNPVGPWLAAIDRGRLDVTAMVVVGLVAAVVRCAGLFDYPALADDEGTYVAQARAVQWGELAHYTYWYDHPPLGWIQVAALDWIPRLLFPGAQPVAVDRLVVVLAATLTTVLLYPVVRRVGGRRATAVAACLLAALSPLAVTLQRQVYLDTLATAWIMLAFLLALDRGHRLWAHVAAGLCFAVAVLTKETTAVLLPALVWAAVQGTPRSTRAFSAVGVIGSTGLVVAFYPLMAALRGELFVGPGHVSLLGGVLFQLQSREGSGEIWRAASASSQVLHGWLFFDPWLLAAGVLTIPVALAVRRLRPLGVASLTLVAVGCRPNGYLPAMYVLTMIPWLALTTATAGEVVWHLAGRITPPLGGERARRWSRRTARAASAVLALGLAVLVVPAWTAGLRGAATAHTNDARAQAEAWMAQHLPPDSVVLTDDVSWVALVDRGISTRSHTIWFYKLDTDPSIPRVLPRGWRDVDIVLSTDQMRLAVAGDPGLVNSAAALRDSVVLASFGSADSAVEVRRVVDPAAAVPVVPVVSSSSAAASPGSDS